MPLEGELFLPGACVPHPHRLVLAPRGDSPAVGAEADAPDRIGVPLEGELLLSGVRVPPSHLAAVFFRAPACRSDPFAVGGERNTEDLTCVPLEGELLLS